MEPQKKEPQSQQKQQKSEEEIPEQSGKRSRSIGQGLEEFEGSSIHSRKKTNKQHQMQSQKLSNPFSSQKKVNSQKSKQVNTPVSQKLYCSDKKKQQSYIEQIVRLRQQNELLRNQNQANKLNSLFSEHFFNQTKSLPDLQQKYQIVIKKVQKQAKKGVNQNQIQAHEDKIKTICQQSLKIYIKKINQNSKNQTQKAKVFIRYIKKYYKYVLGVILKQQVPQKLLSYFQIIKKNNHLFQFMSLVVQQCTEEMFKKITQTNVLEIEAFLKKTEDSEIEQLLEKNKQFHLKDWSHLYTIRSFIYFEENKQILKHAQQTVQHLISSLFLAEFYQRFFQYMSNNIFNQHPGKYQNYHPAKKTQEVMQVLKSAQVVFVDYLRRQIQGLTSTQKTYDKDSETQKRTIFINTIYLSYIKRAPKLIKSFVFTILLHQFTHLIFRQFEFAQDPNDRSLNELSKQTLSSKQIQVKNFIQKEKKQFDLGRAFQIIAIGRSVDWVNGDEYQVFLQKQKDYAQNKIFDENCLKSIFDKRSRKDLQQIKNSNNPIFINLLSRSGSQGNLVYIPVGMCGQNIISRPIKKFVPYQQNQQQQSERRSQ